MTEYRWERDSLGEKAVPKEAYYGIHALRAKDNFPVSGQKPHRELLWALGVVKQAAASANTAVGLLPPEKGEAIERAAAEFASGRFDDQILVDAYAGGAGTPLNMNVNEVIANRALEILGFEKGSYHIIHPLEHVNLSQSTNDVFPTAIKVAAIKLVRRLSQAMARLQGALQRKEKEFASILKIGRTEMQDAVPITLGQEFGAWAEAVARDWWRLYKVEERLRQVNLGGTAVGTGLNASRRYIQLVTDKLRELTGFGLARAENLVEATQNTDIFAEVSGLVKTAAVNLAKIASDLRFLSSGPRAGIGEIRLPAVQVGSSIMPGKVNPVIPEMVTQVAIQVMANDVAISQACAWGNLELNPFLPLIAHNLLTSTEMLANAALILAERCVEGIEADRERCEELLHRSCGLITAFVPYIGYERAAEIVKEALERDKRVEEVLLEKGLFSPEEIAAITSPQEVTTPGIAGIRYFAQRKTAKEGIRDGSESSRKDLAR
ncbi:aspartate ammonia-lyase [Ammonifex thiophilus]|uniref:Aspartate ammonia-lyase n=1 Tax=Ammonifex thiophilus TaxID=444093 RepID=A0A3D8P357_9THEO|nr:aspartate ammonia-lyase [Ammonifex thiophilus]RDV83026.1 aspartate ammonia-lyase [Ammonifex thiophilus]